MKPKNPRTNKTKQIITEEIRRQDDLKREIALCKLIWPIIATQESIYDAQTILNATSGFINFGFQKEMDKVKVRDLKIDLAKEPESEIKEAMISLLALLEPEKSKETASLLERFGKTLAQYGSAQYLKNSMSVLKMKDIIA